LAPRAFRVEVREGQRETTHQVTVPERLGERLELREDELELAGVSWLAPSKLV
jgi:hypothetical protein